MKKLQLISGCNTSSFLNFFSFLVRESFFAVISVNPKVYLATFDKCLAFCQSLFLKLYDFFPSERLLP